MPTFRQTIKVFQDAELSAAAMSARLAETARAALLAAQVSGRAPATYRTFVDGVADGSEDEAVKRIRYEFSFLGDATEYAIQNLLLLSPVASGRYQQSFMVAVDGRAIPAAYFDPLQVPPGVEIFVWNRQPYSRKIDVQYSGNTPLKYKVAPDLFDNAAKAVRSRFGNTVSCKRLNTLNIPGAYVLRRGEKAGSDVDSPALAINQLV